MTKDLPVSTVSDLLPVPMVRLVELLLLVLALVLAYFEADSSRLPDLSVVA
jgi:hypothetical protein